MPIHGLTTQRAVLPPVSGKLHKGSEGKPGKTKNGKDFIGYGDELDHFRFTPLKYNPKDKRAMSEAEAQLVADFAAAYGNEPQRIEVYLPSDEVDVVFDAWQEEWSASQLLHRCNGQFVYERDRATGEYYQTTTPCPWVGKTRTSDNPGCKQIGRLAVILPELVAAGHYGIVTVETHSINDITTIHRALTDFRQRFGRLTGVPFYVYRYPENISTPSGSDGKRARREKWLVGITPATEFVQKQLEAARQHALGNAQIALPAPAIDHETGEIYEGESAPVEMATADQWESINALGKEIYGTGWKTVAPTGIRRITKGRGDKPRDLTQDEAETLFDQLEGEALAVAEAAAKAEVEPLSPMEMPI